MPPVVQPSGGGCIQTALDLSGKVFGTAVLNSGLITTLEASWSRVGERNVAPWH